MAAKRIYQPFDGNTPSNLYAHFSEQRMPIIDKNRLTAVYIRQSDKDAPDNHAESRNVQLGLVRLAIALRGEDHTANIKVYDEGWGISGQKRIDECKKLQELWADIEDGLVGSILVAREDRLFRDKHKTQVAAFVELAEEQKIVVAVPLRRFYDFTVYEDQTAFFEKMIEAYDYIAYHIAYMHANQKNKAMRGCFEGRGISAGYAVSRKVRRFDQRPIIYEPWAKVMKWMYYRLRQLNWSLSRLCREIEKMPYLFPDPTAEDLQDYMIKTAMTKVPGGYKPTSANAIRRMLLNITNIGGWLVDENSGLVIMDNHEPLIERDMFEETYVHLTGYTLDGIEAPESLKGRRFQARVKRAEGASAILRFIIQSPNGLITTGRANGTERDFYTCVTSAKEVREAGKLYREKQFVVACDALDTIFANRLVELAREDRHLATRVKQGMEEIQQARVEECISVDEQLNKLDNQIKHIMDVLKDPYLQLDNESKIELSSDLTQLRGTQRELLEKKRKAGKIDSKEELVEFYDIIGNLPIKWPALPLEKQQRLVQLLVKSKGFIVEIISVHWLKLTVHWIGPVANRPDICLVWRQNGERQIAWASWEDDLIKQLYATCSDRASLLKLMPNRTWHGIYQRANALGIFRQDRKAVDISMNVTWNDLEVIGEVGQAMKVIEEAARAKQYLYPFWLFLAK